MKVGNLVKLNSTGYSTQKGAIGRIYRIWEHPGGPVADIFIFTPKDFYGSNHIYHNVYPQEERFKSKCLQAHLRDLIDVNEEYNEDDIVNGVYEFEIVNGEIVMKKRMKEGITEEVLKSAFKYIPFKYGSYYGFIKDNETILIYDQEVKLAKLDKPSWDQLNSSEFEYIVLPNGKRNLVSKNRQLKPRLATVSLKPLHVFCEEAIIKYCKIRVRSIDRSTTLFGNAKIKREALDKILDPTGIELQAEVKNSTVPENTIWLKINETNYRFSLEDVDIIYPNITGYQIKKDKSIKAGITVRCTNDKHCLKLKKGDRVVVDHIKNIGNKSYIGFMDNENVVYMKAKHFKAV